MGIRGLTINVFENSANVVVGDNNEIIVGFISNEGYLFIDLHIEITTDIK